MVRFGVGVRWFCLALALWAPGAWGQVSTPSALGHSAPVVQPPAHGHAEKPAAPAQARKKPPAKPIAPKPAPPPADAAAAPVVPPAPAVPAVDPGKGTVTGLKLPRWVSLRTDDVNMRAGPGMRYPIEWQYHRRDLPVKVERELEVWRLIEDQDGIKGWVHQATLAARRTFVVIGGDQTLRDAASDGGAAVAILKPGVVGRIRGCEAKAAWCEVQVGEYRGWVPRAAMWGTDADEAITN